MNTLVTKPNQPVPVADLQYADKIAALKEKISIGSLASILTFGSDAVNRTNCLTDTILKRAQSADLGETGSQLSKIVVAAQEFDFDSFDNPMARIPVVGGLLKRLNSTKAKAMARFETVKAQIDRLVATVEKTAETLAARDHEYSEIYDLVRLEHEQLGLHIEALNARLVEVEAELASLMGSQSDMNALERQAVLETARNAMAKRADDLTVLRHSAMQTLPMIRIIQSNNFALVDKFATIRSLTLPAWKRAFMMAISIEEQKEANDLATSIDDTTNMLLKRNAELLKQSSIAVARSGQRLVIDVETLKSVHETIISTLQDVRQAHADGAAARGTAIRELANLRTELAQAVHNAETMAA